MKSLPTVFLWPVALLALEVVSTGGAGQPALPARVSNHTLHLPDRVPSVGYRLVDGFPGITFDQPVALCAPPQETNRLYVAERRGAIYVITNLAQPTNK